MKRTPSPEVVKRNEHIVGRIKELKPEHPFWGYRRIWAHLTYVDKLEVNKEGVSTNEAAWPGSENTRLKAKRTPGRSKPRIERPDEIWGIDMTKS